MFTIIFCRWYYFIFINYYYYGVNNIMLCRMTCVGIDTWNGRNIYTEYPSNKIPLFIRLK